MFSFITSYFTPLKFIHSYNFNEDIGNNSYMILGITNDKKIGLSFHKFYKYQDPTNVIRKIHKFNYYLGDRCNNNEVMYYFGDDDHKIRLKFYVKNNYENSMKDFYYHLFSVEENLDIHIKLCDEYIDFFTNPRFYEMSQHFRNSDFVYFINLISQDRKIINNKIPFICIKENVVKVEPQKKEINLLSF